MRIDETRFSYYQFLRKLCDGEYHQSELNYFIERLFKIAKLYINQRYSRIKRIVEANHYKLEDIAVDTIVPLFHRTGDNNEFSIVIETRKWNPPIRSEEESLFFIITIIANRVGQQISRILRESDPFFSRILDSVNYLVRSRGYYKLNYHGTFFILESDNMGINLNVIDHDEFQKIPSNIFCEKEKLLQSVMHYLKTETDYFPAIPLNELVIKLKHINVSWHIADSSSNKFMDKIEIDEAVKNGLCHTERKLKETYLSKGKINQFEYDGFMIALKAITEDLKDGGISPGLHKYLTPYFNNLSYESYQTKYRNILEYLFKHLKENITEELKAN